MPAAVRTSVPGLTEDEAAARLARDGPNRLPEARGPSLLRQYVAQLTHLLALLLWAAVVLAWLAGMPALSLAIAVIVVLNATFAFWQEYRADRSAAELSHLLPTTTRVVRDGLAVSVEAVDLVRGDLVLLTTGDRVAADARVEVARDLRLDESLVTGESGGIVRRPGEHLLAGTFVVQGEAEATVVATGRETTLAGISALAGTAVRPPSPLTTQLARVVRVVAVVAAVTGALLGTSAMALGLDGTDAFLFGVGVAVALVPEGLLPTVTLSLARGAQLMAGRKALVRRLDAVETLGATTFICTDKTGTLTQNRMAVVEVVTDRGAVSVVGEGYEPEARIEGPPEVVRQLPAAAAAALRCVTGRAVRRPDGWGAEGDPMEAAVHAFALRCEVEEQLEPEPVRRPYTAERMLSSCQQGTEVSVLGAPEHVLERCRSVPAHVPADLERMTRAGRRVLAVARRDWRGPLAGTPSPAAVDSSERDLDFLGLLGLEDPPREDVGEALDACRTADIRVVMVTGDHPSTAEAIAREVGLLRGAGPVLTGDRLPAQDDELGALLDHPEGAVVARVSPADKFRIARVLRERGHVVAMTGDGVNDAPALREADVGVAMGLGGSDVAREAADLVLLDDHFGTIVAAVELGRATFQNVRRFLTYHLTDNVAELTPFALWALSGGEFPLAITVLQVLALDIGTDMLPALALGAEPANPRVMRGRPGRPVVDRVLLWRAFGILGPTEAVASMVAFAIVLQTGGWSWGETPSDGLLAVASGTAFTAISLGQMANAFACRSASRPVWRIPFATNRLVLYAVLAEILLLLAFVGIPAMRSLLGGGWPSAAGWGLALLGALLLLVVDASAKWVIGRQRESGLR